MDVTAVTGWPVSSKGIYKGDKGKGAAVALYPIITLAAILRGLPFPNVGGTGESFNTFRYLVSRLSSFDHQT